MYFLRPNLLLLSLTIFNSWSVAAERPNIVVLFADDMGYSDIGCFGSEIETPNLDRLASNGLRYTHFYNTGRCCPSRSSILTGLYPHQADIGHMAGDLGVKGYRDRLSFNAVTMAEVMGVAGYHTLMSGKWHLGWRDEGSPTARGFEKFYGTRGYIDSYYTTVNRTEMYLGAEMVIPVTEHPVNHLKPDEEWYTTDVFTDYALHFIDEVTEKDDEPFFLYLAYNAPHFPLHGKPENTAKYRGKYKEGWGEIRLERYRKLVELGVIEDQWALSALDVPEWDSLSEEQREDMDFKMALFAGIIDRLDQNIGRLVDHLEKLGELDNTLIVFLSDNGGTKETGLFGIDGEKNTVKNYETWSKKGGWTSSYGQGWANLSNVPFRQYKRENHEGGISAPFIAHWPAGIKAKGELRHQVAHLIDLMPTFVDVSGAIYPVEFKGKKILPMEGQSLVSSFSTSNPSPRTLYWEHEGNRAIREGDWKLVGSKKGPWELYEIAKDRTELRDLTSSEPEIFAALEAKWNVWAEKVGVLTPDEFDAAKKATAGKNEKEHGPVKKLALNPEALPMAADFSSADLSAWEFFGGDWKAGEGTLKVKGENGPRAVLKNLNLSSFELEVEIKAEPDSQAGVIYRVQNSGNGVNAFQGYYTGMHTGSKQVMWGASDQSWSPIARRSEPIVPNQWHQFRLQVSGKNLKCFINDLPVEEGCFPKFDGIDGRFTEGQVGFRVLGAGAEFRNLKIRKFESPVLTSSYTNPVQSACADPVVLKHEEMYYAYCTFTPDFPTMPHGIRAYSSSDLVHWKDCGYVLKKEDSWGESKFWAPDIIEKDGTFYLYYAAETRICMATSDSPLGPFKQKTKEPMAPEQIRIDGHVFQDDDGQAYIYYVQFNKGNEIWAGKLNEDMMTVDEKSLKLMVKPDQPWERQKGKITEGPEVLKHKGTYYLTYSGSHFESPEYAVGYATSDNPLGPWKKYEFNPIMKSTAYAHGTAHHCFTESPDGSEMFIVYHRHHSLTETEPRQMSIDRIHFVPQKNGPDILEVWGPTSSPQPMPSGIKN